MPHLLKLYIQFLVAVIPCVSLRTVSQPKKRRERIQTRLSKGNTQLTFSYCFLHLWGILELYFHVAVINYPFPFWWWCYFFHFEFQRTASNDICSSTKDIGDTVVMHNRLCEWTGWCVQGCLILHGKAHKSLKSQRALIWLPSLCQQYYVSSTMWGQPWLGQTILPCRPPRMEICSSLSDLL